MDDRLRPLETGAIERAGGWIYRRLGARQFAWVMVAIVAPVMAALIVALFAVVFARYFDISGAEAWALLGVMAGSTAIGYTVGAASIWPSLRPLFAWAEAEPRPAPDRDLWERAVSAASRAWISMAKGTLSLAVPAWVVYLSISQDLSITGWAIVLVGSFMSWLCAAVFFLFLTDAAARPVIRDVNDHVTEGWTATAWLSVPARVFLGAMGLAFIASFVVGSIAIERGSGVDGLARVELLSVVFSVGLATLIGGFYSETIVGPIRDLLRGTRQVGAGDLEARVGVQSRDEFGQLAASFNDMVGDLRESADDLTKSRSRIVAAADESRRKVERDLHDGAQQSLVLLNLKLGVLERRAGEDPELATLAREVRADLDRALDELRDLAHGIYPQVLSTDGLAAALAEAAAEAPVAVETSIEGARRHPPEIEAAVYFCCLEALQNAGKHAGEGARVRLSFAESAEALRFEVADDGAGFDLASQNGSAGLQNMADRIGALGGELAVDSAPGEGTRVAGSVPVGDTTSC